MRSEVGDSIVLEVERLRELVAVIQVEGPVEDQDSSSDCEVLGRDVVVDFFFSQFEDRGGEVGIDVSLSFGYFVARDEDWERIVTVISLVHLSDLYGVVNQVVLVGKWVGKMT